MRRLPAISRRLREAALDDVVESGRREWRKRRESRWLGFKNLREQARLRRRLERPSAGGHLVQDAAEREDVRPRIRWRALHLFRGHVLHRADDRALCGAGPGGGGQHRQRLSGRTHRLLREAEIEQLRACRGEHHVSRLQVAMDDTLSMCDLKGIRHLDAETEDLVKRQRAPLQTGRQRLALEQFEHQILGVVLAADVVQPADVRVIERGDRFGFLCKPGAEPGVTGQLRRENLDGDAAVQARVARRYTSPMPPAPSSVSISKWPSRSTRAQCHWSGRL